MYYLCYYYLEHIKLFLFAQSYPCSLLCPMYCSPNSYSKSCAFKLPVFHSTGLFIKAVLVPVFDRNIQNIAWWKECWRKGGWRNKSSALFEIKIALFEEVRTCVFIWIGNQTILGRLGLIWTAYWQDSKQSNAIIKILELYFLFFFYHFPIFLFFLLVVFGHF